MHGGWCPTHNKGLEMAIDSEMLQMNTMVSHYFFESLLNGCKNGKMQKLPNSERFALSTQTLIYTSKCQAALIEDLLREGYKYVLTARFQSDPLEKRYGQYHQMSGGRFLVSIKDVMRSENILKIKSLFKEGSNIHPSLKEDGKYEEATAKLLEDVESTLPNLDAVQLNSRSKEVSDNVAKYIVHKTKSIFNGCCEEQMTKHTDNKKIKTYHLELLIHTT